ncbi:MAG: small multi-drug export protein [Lachnospiraceae bacterium]|nr:small multi-drug export protein [Lachnospiraceae bacterium]
MAEKIGTWFAATFSWLPKEAVVFIVSMLPLVELRGGLILAPLFGIPIWKAVMICLVGNIIPIPFILWFITPIFTWMKGTRLFKPIVEKLEAKSMGKSDRIQKYEFWGLVLFVGIPLPGTGAWTGALIASLLNIRIKKAFPAILIGLLLATTIMCTITYLIPWIISNVAA